MSAFPIGTPVVTIIPSAKNILGHIHSSLIDDTFGEYGFVTNSYSQKILLESGEIIKCNSDFIKKVDLNNLPKHYHLPRMEQDKLLDLSDFDKKEIELEIAFNGENSFSRKTFKGQRFFVVREIKEYKFNNDFKTTKLIL